MRTVFSDIEKIVTAGGCVIVDNSPVASDLKKLASAAKISGGSVTIRGAAKLAASDLIEIARLGKSHVTLDLTD